MNPDLDNSRAIFSSSVSLLMPHCKSARVSITCSYSFFLSFCCLLIVVASRQQKTTSCQHDLHAALTPKKNIYIKEKHDLGDDNVVCRVRLSLSLSLTSFQRSFDSLFRLHSIVPFPQSLFCSLSLPCRISTCSMIPSTHLGKMATRRYVAKGTSSKPIPLHP